MFGYKYKMLDLATGDQTVVKLAPTASTYAKAFAPAIVIWAVMGVAYAVGSREDKADLEYMTDYTKDPDQK